MYLFFNPEYGDAIVDKEYIFLIKNEVFEELFSDDLIKIFGVLEEI